MQLLIQADLAALSNRLGNLAAALDGDLSEVMGGIGSIGSILEGSTRNRFATGKTSPDGERWQALSARTRAHKTGGSILVEHGALMRGITHEASKDSVIVGSGQLYARYHQEGTERMPARPFLGISPEDYRDIDDLLADWLDGKI